MKKESIQGAWVATWCQSKYLTNLEKYVQPNFWVDWMIARLWYQIIKSSYETYIFFSVHGFVPIRVKKATTNVCVCVCVCEWVRERERERERVDYLKWFIGPFPDYLNSLPLSFLLTHHLLNLAFCGGSYDQIKSPISSTKSTNS